MKRPLMICLIISLIFLIAVTQSVLAAEYSFITIDYPDVDRTQVRGINDVGKIVGWYGNEYLDGNTTKVEWHSFLYDDNTNIYTRIDYPNAFMTEAADINDAGMILGKYRMNESDSGFQGFLYDGSTYTPFNYLDSTGAAAPSSCPNGINDSGRISGAYKDASDIWHGFWYEGTNFGISTNYHHFDYDDKVSTDAIHINNNGIIVGWYHDSGGNSGTKNGFLYDSLAASADTDIYGFDYPGVDWTTAYGINDTNQIVGQYYDSVVKHGFLAVPPYNDDNYITIDYPGADWTWPFGINNNNQIVGWYGYGTEVHGFIASFLAASWPMDENGENQDSIVYDETSNNNDGTIYGSGVDWIPSSRVGASALSFDGTTGSYVGIPNSDDINTGGPYTDRTITAWFKVNNVDTRQMIYEEGGGARGFNIYVNTDSKVYVGGWNRAEYDPYWSGTWLGKSISAGTWYHVALVLKDGTDTVGSDKFKGYLNGVKFGSGDGGKVYEHGGDINIGKAGNTRYHDWEVVISDGEYFNGIIDEVKVYNSALTVGEIARMALISDSDPPVITYATGNTSSTTGEAKTVSATITDNVDVVSATVYYTPIDGAETSIAMTEGDSDLWSTSVPVASNKVGTITYYITAKDAFDNTAIDPDPGTYDISVTDNDAPVAEAGPDQSAEVDEVLTFDCSASTDNIGITSCSWDFGDGYGDTGVTVTHAYSTTGIYTVTLTVSDAAGNSDTDTLTVTVTTNNPPVADADGPYSATTGNAITFDGSGSYDPDGDTIAYYWDFGNGDTGTGMSPTYTYTVVGTYTVTLIVNDGQFDSSPATTTATITEPEVVTEFYDSFEINEWNNLWVEDSQNDWFRSSQRASDSSYSAEIDGSATNATLTMKNAIDLSGRTSATLTFSWYIESSWDSGEYICLDIYYDGSWHNGTPGSARCLDGNQDAENVWHNESFSWTYMTSDFKIRFRANVSNFREDGNVDDVKIMSWM